MKRDKAERELIAGTISDLRDSIEELESRIQFMSEDLATRRTRLEVWRKRLVALASGEDSADKRRRPKGANLRAVTACLEKTLTGLAASEIQRKTELPWSSIQATLKRNATLFVEESGLWRLRREITRNGAKNGVSDDVIEEELAKEQ